MGSATTSLRHRGLWAKFSNGPTEQQSIKAFLFQISKTLLNNGPRAEFVLGPKVAVGREKIQEFVFFFPETIFEYEFLDEFH